jgi:addiction module HigA family antidote
MNRLNKFRGIHPGIILKRELERLGLKQRPFALSLAEHPQTFNAIAQGKRSLTPALALKIDRKLGMKEGTFYLLQAYYEIKQATACKKQATPDLTKLRKALFWDTDWETMDWEKRYKAVIRRVFEYGNEEEKKEIIRFYGKARVSRALITENGTTV